MILIRMLENKVGDHIELVAKDIKEVKDFISTFQEEFDTPLPPYEIYQLTPIQL